MSFSWYCKDRDGRDMFDEFKINPQALGLGPNCPDDTSAPYRVSDIRDAWISIGYKDKLKDAAQDAVRAVQVMVLENMRSLKPHHCETCTCREIKPKGWEKDQIERFLLLPVERVWRAGGGY